MSDAIDIEGLMAAARDPTPEGRSRLFSLLGGLFLARGAELPEDERRGFAELLEILRASADVEARLTLAHATAEAQSAPLELAKLLAQDEIEIAALVLYGSKALGSAELLLLADREERARVIAVRRHLPMLVADALMRRGDAEIARALLKNETIKLSIPAFAEAIELARADADLQSRVAERPELIEEMAIEMLEWAEAPVRERLIERYEIGPVSSAASRRQALASLGLESGAAPEADFTGAGAAGEKADRGGGTRPDPRFRLSPRLMIETLRRGELVQAEAMFAQMAALPMPLVRRIAKDADGASAAIAARAIGMSREEFATLYLLWRKAHSPDGLVAAGDLGTALDLFDTIPQDRVEVEVAKWRRGEAERA